LSKGKVILIPCTLGDVNPLEVLPQTNNDFINSCDIFIVENLRSARRFLIKTGLKKAIDEIQFFEINKRTKAEDLLRFLSELNEGKNIGVLSEAGCPGIADPGAEIVKWAHRKNIQIIPLIGPSSILLALMASGMNGQNFAFIGYLPKEKTERRRKIKQLEQYSKTHNQTQIFIETPFRNNHLIDDLQKCCDKNTQIVVACDLTLPTQFIKRLSAKDWKNHKLDLHKRPCIFILHKY
tara:strand:+ start:27826 stop:28536 length:711 start_codon:yes stop_codon:yes gene_type:complete